MTKFWQWLPAQLTHSLAPFALGVYASFLNQPVSQWKSFHWKGLHFPNPFGIAGGVDKNGEHLLTWQTLGSGFFEVGTVTPEPQTANPGKILGRNWKELASWNRMGFPNFGAEEVYYNLLKAKPDLERPLFVNIGKNRNTSTEKAHFDYANCANILKNVADVFVVNISSPNTSGLRDLQNEKNITEILKAVQDHAAQPVLVKLSPDMEESAFHKSLAAAAKAGASGFVLTNTTLQRTPQIADFPKEGGVAGKPLAELSKQSLKKAFNFFSADAKKYLFVSAGGITNPDDAIERLNMGCQLIQTYSGLIFYGPKLFIDTAKKGISSEHS